MTATTDQTFFDKPILNSPYVRPARHWELDEDGRPTNNILPQRRSAALISVIPGSKKRARSSQTEMVLDAGHGLSTDVQEYNPTPIINELRQELDTWRQLPNPQQWQVTPATAPRPLAAGPRGLPRRPSRAGG